MENVFSFIKSIISSYIGAPIRGMWHGHIFQEDDGTTDLSRVLGAFMILAFLAYQGWALYQKQQFDANAFGTGGAALCAGVGVFILAHAKSTNSSNRGS